MINFEFINAYTCQPESDFTRWEKDENMAFCEGFSVLCSENKKSRFSAFITSIFTFIMK